MTGTAGLVLVADDSAVMRAVLRRELNKHGWKVAEAADGTETVRRCREMMPEVVLLDIEMPRMNGFQVLAAMSGDPQLCDTPVIFLTARDSGQDVAEGLRRGAHDYLRKPFEPVELLARVLLAQRMKSLRDQLTARNQELERLAMTDALTGVRNRRWMQERVADLAARHQRDGTPLSALMLDVDHFKRINDRHGHDAGDAVLREVAGRIAGHLTGEDAVARWGGEEFLLLLSDRRVAGAEAVAGELLDVVAEPIDSLDVTVSIGVAGLVPDDSPLALVNRADDALYAAKASGRNTWRTAPPPASAPVSG